MSERELNQLQNLTQAVSENTQVLVRHSHDLEQSNRVIHARLTHNEWKMSIGKNVVSNFRSSLWAPIYDEWHDKQGEFFIIFEDYRHLCKIIEMQLASDVFSEYAHVKILPVGGQFDGNTVRRSHSG
jgi:hypothetical protein